MDRRYVDRQRHEDRWRYVDREARMHAHKRVAPCKDALEEGSSPLSHVWPGMFLAERVEFEADGVEEAWPSRTRERDPIR